MQTQIELPTNLYASGFRWDKPADDDLNFEKIKKVRRFIRDKFTKTKTITKSYSYWSGKLKHIAEDALGDEVGNYVSNGDLIAAMILEGYNYKIEMGLAHFNISKKSVDAAKGEPKYLRKTLIDYIPFPIGYYKPVDEEDQSWRY